MSDKKNPMESYEEPAQAFGFTDDGFEELVSNEPKQVIVVRNDLRKKMRGGKLAAQVAHASMAAFNGDFEVFRFTDDGQDYMETPLTDAKAEWITTKFAKVVLRCDDLDEMMDLLRRAKERGLPTALITDEGRTVFREPTTTCLGIGPVFPVDLIGLTDELKMW